VIVLSNDLIAISKEYNKQMIKKWGKDSQIVKTISEMAELSSILCDYLLYGEKTDWKNEDKNLKSKIESEIADVLITVNSLLVIFDEKKVSTHITFKLLRVITRLKEYEKCHT